MRFLGDLLLTVVFLIVVLLMRLFCDFGWVGVTHHSSVGPVGMTEFRLPLHTTGTHWTRWQARQSLMASGFATDFFNEPIVVLRRIKH